MKASVLFCLLAMMATSCTLVRREPPADPKAAVVNFTNQLRKLKVRGLPQDQDWKTLKPLVTPKLASAVETAQQVQATFAKEHADEKPPWIEGDLFGSLFEGPQNRAVGDAHVKKDRAEVPVQLTYSDSGETVQWTDTFLALKSSRGWLIDDIRYGGTWDFAMRGTLTGALKPE